MAPLSIHTRTFPHTSAIDKMHVLCDQQVTSFINRIHVHKYVCMGVLILRHAQQICTVPAKAVQYKKKSIAANFNYKCVHFGGQSQGYTALHTWGLVVSGSSTRSISNTLDVA